MEDEKNTKEKLEKIDKVTKIITIFVCTILGAIFLAACTYMLKMISSEQQENSNIKSQIII